MASSHPPKSIEILLVEDNAADIRLTREAFRGGHLENHLHVARDGVEALAFVRREPGYEEAVRPDLILLDLNLPRMGGFELLRELKGDPGLRRIPVVILTTSNAEGDIARSYDLFASSYITKPIEFDRFIDVVRSIESYWLTIVATPEG